MIISLNLVIVKIVRVGFVLLMLRLILIVIRSHAILHLHAIPLILHCFQSFKPLLLYVKFVHLKLLVHVLNLLNLFETLLLVL